jgi:hypothetical protein
VLPVRQAFALALLAITMGAPGAEPKQSLTREQMMPIVQKATWSFCHQPRRRIVDCQLSLMFIDGYWSVVASPVFQQLGGKPYCCAVDQEAFFDFSPSGKLIRTIHAQ